MNRTAIITGASGDIGRTLCDVFRSRGYFVLGTDRRTGATAANAFIEFDLREIATSPEKSNRFLAACRKAIGDRAIHTLVNNAAIQILESACTIRRDAWHETLDVNVVAPFFLTQMLADDLKASSGRVINISSIHGHQTKTGFSAYAASKCALLSVTRSLALEYGRHFTVNAIVPAAIGTEMLEASFKGRPEHRKKLDELHPTGSIGTPEQVAEIAHWISDIELPFLNGSCIGLDGGISACLTDPTSLSSG